MAGYLTSHPLYTEALGSVTCDLSIETLKAAMGSNPPIYLHVHPSKAALARTILDEGKQEWWRTRPIIVADKTLQPNEWYLTSNVGSRAVNG